MKLAADFWRLPPGKKCRRSPGFLRWWNPACGDPSGKPGARHGFSLVELSIALGIAAFALIAIFGLLPVGVGSNNASIRQTEAVNLASGFVEDLRQAPPGAGAVSPRYQIEFDQNASSVFIDRSGQPVPHEQADYRVSVTMLHPPQGRRQATSVSVVLSWPATMDAPLHALSTFVALDRN
jgi:uncharacterized protein (TIGR02598 family)